MRYVFSRKELRRRPWSPQLSLNYVKLTSEDLKFIFDRGVTHLAVDCNVTFSPMKHSGHTESTKEQFWARLLGSNSFIWLSLGGVNKFDGIWKLVIRTPLSATLVNLRLPQFDTKGIKLVQLTRALELKEIVKKLRLYLIENKALRDVQAQSFNVLFQRKKDAELALEGALDFVSLIAVLLRYRYLSEIVLRLQHIPLKLVPRGRRAVLLLGSCYRAGVCIEIRTRISRALLKELNQSEAQYLQQYARSL